MAIHKGPVREQFTQIPNKTHQDTSLSLQARGLLGYLISLPDDWVVRPEQLAKVNGIAKNTAYKLIKELREAGYIFPVQRRASSGKFSTGDYLVFRSLEDAAWYAETPENSSVEPCTKKRDAVKRDTVNCELSNKEENKEISKSVNSTQFENFSEKVLVELLSDNLPESKLRYAQLKIQEFEERFPESFSAADCYSYVGQALTHKYNLTGS